MFKFFLYISGIFILFFTQVTGQSIETIKLDSLGRADKIFPFDVDFNIQKDMPTNDINGIFLYRVVIKNGQRELFDNTRFWKRWKRKTGKKDSVNVLPDYIFKNEDVLFYQNGILLHVPPLKPNRDFDIEVRKDISDKNLQSARELNIKLINGVGVISRDSIKNSITASPQLKQFFSELQRSANNTPNKDRVILAWSSINEFNRRVTDSSKPIYSSLTTGAGFRQLNELSVGNILLIRKGVDSIFKSFRDVYLLEKVRQDTTFTMITNGLLKINYGSIQEVADKSDIQTRIANLTASKSYYDTLYQSINEMVILDSVKYLPLLKQVHDIKDSLLFNKQLLSKKLDSIDAIIKRNAPEGIWFVGSTSAKDLQTKGSSIFTVDLGVANIWARDLDNKNAYIPKLYYGINIFFRSVDKTIKWKYLPKSFPKHDTTQTFSVLSRGTIMQRLCLTAGFTIGSLDKNNFDNFFGGSSLLLGPGFLITRSFRVSTGFCFLKRSTLNPLKTDKKFTTGYYLTASLDFDLLGTLNKITGLLIK